MKLIIINKPMINDPVFLLILIRLNYFQLCPFITLINSKKKRKKILKCKKHIIIISIRRLALGHLNFMHQDPHLLMRSARDLYLFQVSIG